MDRLKKPSPTSRRRLLVLGLLLACSTVACTLAGMTRAFLRPPLKKGGFGGLVNAGTLLDLPPAGAAPRLVPQGRFWLVHHEAGLRAIHNSCTHLQCLFGWDEEKEVFICPCHGSEFSRLGKVLKGPATRDLDCFPLQVIDDRETLIRHSQEQRELVIADLMKIEDDPAHQREQAQTTNSLFLQVDTGRPIAGKTGNG